MHTRWTSIKQTDSEENHNLKIENSKVYRGKYIGKTQWNMKSMNSYISNSSMYG